MDCLVKMGGRICCRYFSSRKEHGFTLTEIVIVMAIIIILGAVTVPTFSSLYGECCVKAVMSEVTEMIKEGKSSALMDDKDYAIVFRVATGTIALLSGKGADDKWNTEDDIVVRKLCLKKKGGGLCFGYGSYPKPADLVESADGITFQNKTLVCNARLTGSSGTVYIRSSYGAAMALTMNTKDFGYTLRRWNGNEWAKL